MSNYCPREFHTVKFWFDCEPHFRSKEVLYHTLKHASNHYDKITEFNFFAPSHGINDCDTHFLVLSRWSSEAEKSTSFHDYNQLIELWNRNTIIRNNGNQHTNTIMYPWMLVLKFIPDNQDPTTTGRSVYQTLKASSIGK